MIRNKLHTVNKWNKPAFMQENVFDGLTMSTNQMQTGKGLFNYNLSTPTALTAPKVDWSNATQRNMALGQTKALTNSFGSGNPVNLQQSNQMLSNTISGSGGSDVGSGLFSKENNSPYIMAANTAAPTVGSLIGGGYHSGVGDTIGTVGSTVGSLVGTVNPALGLAINVGSQVIGGAVNGLFGEKADEKALAQANAGTNYLGNFISDAGSYDDLEGIQDQAMVDDPYSGGIFNSSAKRKNAKLKRERENALSWAERSVENNIDNIWNDQMNNYLANYSAEGGKIEIKHPGRLTELKKRTGKTEAELWAEGKPEVRKMITFARNSRKWSKALGGKISRDKVIIPDFMCGGGKLFALGGDVQTNGSDFTTGLTHISAGQSHEENPYGGIQVGVDSQNVPNLVEENETIFNDYVFSNRILADDATKQKFRLPKKRDITFAEVSKRLEREASERPNDPISQSALHTQMAELEEQQERQKAEMEAEEARQAFEALSPEEQVAVMQQAAQEEMASAQQEQAAQEMAMQEAGAVPQPTEPSQEEMLMAQQQAMADGSEADLGQEVPVMAEGGKINRFDGGGKKPKKHPGKFKDAKGMWNKYTRKGLEAYLGELEARMAMAPDEETRQAIRQEAIDTFAKIQQGYANIYPSQESDTYDYSDAVRNHQNEFNKAKGNTGFYTTDGNGNVTNLIAQDIDIPTGGDVEDIPTNWADGYWGPRTSIRNFGSTEYGDDAYYKDLTDRFAKIGLKYAPNEDWKYNNNNNTLYGLSLLNAPSHGTPDRWDYAEGRWEGPADGTPAPTLPTPGDTSNPGVTPQDTVAANGERRIRPVYRNESLRYAGLFGPAVGLGMQMAGIGRPDTSGIDAAVNSGRGLALAKYKPLGNYMTYRPMDIWYEQNRLNANTRATDRAIANNASPTGTRMAGLLASEYNNQIGSGNLYRQALEYNDAQRARIADFNRGTDQFNADAYNRTSQFNADARNRARQYNAQLQMQAAGQKMAADQAWNQGIYGNVAGLFKGIGDLGTENYRHNRIADMAATGIFGTMKPETFVSNGFLRYETDEERRRRLSGNISAKGGKLPKKKKGLTF